MSESRTVCPFCNRPPGGVHADTCARSAKRHRALHELARRSRGYWFKVVPIGRRWRHLFSPEDVAQSFQRAASFERFKLSLLKVAMERLTGTKEEKS